MIAAAALALPGTAWAAEAPPGDQCQRACGGNFGTWFEQSPVVLCMTADACRFGGKP